MAVAIGRGGDQEEKPWDSGGRRREGGSGGQASGWEGARDGRAMAAGGGSGTRDGVGLGGRGIEKERSKCFFV